MPFLSAIISTLLFLWSLFIDWLLLFISPLKNPEMLWIIIPIWINWFFAEFFQEKGGTSFGNAISNGAVPLIIGIDWARYITNQLTEGTLKFSAMIVFKYFLCLLVIIYGFTIIYYGIKARHFVRFYGRIREVTYVLVMFTPVIYGIVAVTWQFVLAMVLFFPLFYCLIELIDIWVPNPKAVKSDENKEDRFSFRR
ncbi:MAG TPA: hypothetical protein VJI75_03050 [Candidatus Nanoarchaeia archaeon]|nr:hypothetical protein [Candidatus Nanoarchaeia archaeon]